MVNTKLLGLPTDNHLNLKNNEDQMIPRLSGTCYAVRSMFHISNINTLKPVYLNFLGLFPKIVEDTLQSKVLELWLVQNVDIHTVVYLSNKRLYLFHSNMYFPS
jgi:hypothetical protein